MDRTLFLAGYDGFYWSNTVLSDARARFLTFSKGSSDIQANYYRYYGFSLRWLVYRGDKAETKDYLLLLYTSTGRAT